MSTSAQLIVQITNKGLEDFIKNGRVAVTVAGNLEASIKKLNDASANHASVADREAQAVIAASRKKIEGISAEERALRSAITAQNRASTSITAAKRNESNSVVSDLHRQIAAEYDAIAAKLRAAAQSGVVSARFIAQSKLETDRRVADLRRQIAEQSKNTYEADRATRGITSALTGLSTKLYGVAAAYLSVQGSIRLFNSAIESAAGYQTLERQLEFLAGSAPAAAQELQYLTDVSNRYGTVLLQSTESYSALASAMKLSNVAMRDIHQTYEAISAVAATYALSQDKVNAIMLAFTQIAGKGRVQSEELVRQLGQYIPALQLGAKAMGMSIQEFNKALKDGAVASDEFLPKFSALVNQMYGKDLERKTDTITASVNRLTTAWQQFLNVFANESGLARGYQNILDFYSSLLNHMTGADKQIEEFALDAARAFSAETWNDQNVAKALSAFSSKAASGGVQEITNSITILQAQAKQAKSDLDALSQGSTTNLFGQKGTIENDVNGIPTFVPLEESAAKYNTQLGLISTAISFLTQKRDELNKTNAEDEEAARITAQIKALGELDSKYDAWYAKQAQRGETETARVSRFYDEELSSLAVLMVSEDEEVRKSAQEKYLTVSEFKQKELGAIEDRNNTARENTIQQARISTLGEIDAIRAGAELKKSEMEKYFGDSKAQYDEWEKLYNQYIDNEVKQVEDAEKKKTESIINALSKRDMQQARRFMKSENRFDNTAQGSIVGGIKTAGIDMFAGSDSQASVDDQYQREFDALEAYQQKYLESEENYQQKKMELQQRYADASDATREARQQTALSTEQQVMGDLLTLAQTGNKQMMAVYKAAAIAQTTIATLQSAQNVFNGFAMMIPGPAGFVAGTAAAAVSIAAGMARIQAISQQSFATGGYTGSGGKYEEAGIVHKGENVWTQEDVRAAGGPAAAERIRKMYGAASGNTMSWNGYGYANGGPVYAAPTPTINSSSNVSVPITINNSTDSEITTTRRRVNGQDVIEIAVAQAKAEILNDVTGKNGSFSSALRSSWGIG